MYTMYFNLLTPTTSLQVPLGTLRSQLISPWVQLALPICAWVWSLVCTWLDWPTFPACMFSLIPILVYYYFWTGQRFLLFLLVFWFAYKERVSLWRFHTFVQAHSLLISLLAASPISSFPFLLVSFLFPNTHESGKGRTVCSWLKRTHLPFLSCIHCFQNNSPFSVCGSHTRWEHWGNVGLSLGVHVYVYLYLRV